MTTKKQRPLSPHLTIYQPQISTTLSIFHRLTGVFLTFGTVYLFAWLMSAAMGPEAYTEFRMFGSSWFGILLLFGWSWSFFYHLCTGIRHLFWDIGMGYDLKTMTFTGWIAVLSSFGLTFALWSLYLVN